jgi:hypothetical protein
MLCLPTGAGKTFTAVKFLSDHIDTLGVIFWVAHLGELLDDSERSLLKFFDKKKIHWWNRYEKVDLASLRHGDIVLVQIQSTRTFDPSVMKKGLTVTLLIDESHREAAKSYRTFEELLRPDHKLGLTATPYRLDNKSLSFDSIAYSRTLLSLANQGWLAKPKYVRVNTDRKFDLITTAGDFTKKSMGLMSGDDVRSKFVAAHYVKNKDQYGCTIIFAPGIAASKVIEDILTLKKIRAKSLSGEDDKPYRDAVVRDFREGKLEVLINVQLFTAGFDCPRIRTVFMARPTMSKTLWLQAVGRGARVRPPRVPPCEDSFFIVDFIDQVSFYPLVAEEFSTEFLGAPPGVLLKAKKVIEERTEDITELVKGSPETLSIVAEIAKKGKILDLVGSMKVTDIYRSQKAGKQIYKIYPIFKQEYHILKEAAKLLRDMYVQNDSRSYGFIETSYERGGNKTDMTRNAWVGMMWALANLYRSKYKGHKFPYVPLETSYYVKDRELPPEEIMLPIMDMNEPLADKKAQIKQLIEKVSNKTTPIEYSGIDYNTVFILFKRSGWYYFRNSLDRIESTISSRIKCPIRFKVITSQ